MQIIIEVEATPREYVDRCSHAKLRPPARCPHCGVPAALHALGYYRRFLAAAAAQVLHVTIRRFRCRFCGRTVSLLPSFAQPYRLVENETIEAFGNGEVGRKDVSRWREVLRRYWKRFVAWLPQLKRILHTSLGRDPPLREPKRWWRLIILSAGSVDAVTKWLVSSKRQAEHLLDRS